MSPGPFKVAVVQAEAEWLDLPKSVAKTKKYIEDAAKAGAALIAFPEVWIPGYPIWIWHRPVDPVLGAKYAANSLVCDSPEMRDICACAQEFGIVVVLGYSENSHGSLYIGQAIIDADGKLLCKRRKMKPTHMERTIFGDASGSTLDNVVDTKVGRVGALSCWEHTQPLLKYHTGSLQEAIHIAAWPPLFPPSPSGMELYSMTQPGCETLARTYAIETGTFVLHACATLSQKGIDAMQTTGGLIFGEPGGGGSAIFGPDGRKLNTEGLKDGEEGLVLADIDIGGVAAMGARSFLHVTGHYSRPDLMRLVVDRREKSCVEYRATDG